MKKFLRFEGEERESKLLGYQINWRRWRGKVKSFKFEGLLKKSLIERGGIKLIKKNGSNFDW